MTVSAIGVDEGTSKYLSTNQRSISSVNREEQFVLLGEPAYPTYTAIASNISIATTAAHVMFIQADGTAYSRLVYADIQVAAATAIGTALVQVYRTSTAGSGGGAVTVGAFDSADSYTGTVQTLPSSKGTETTLLWQRRIPINAPTLVQPITVPFFDARNRGKPIVFGNATGAGICFKIASGISGATVDIVALITQTTYL